MCEALEKIKNETYAIEHNPNCPNPFLVRLVGKGGCLDKKPSGKTKDILGYGETLEMAVSRASAFKMAHETFQILKDPNNPNTRVILAVDPRA